MWRRMPLPRSSTKPNHAISLKPDSSFLLRYHAGFLLNCMLRGNRSESHELFQLHSLVAYRLWVYCPASGARGYERSKKAWSSHSRWRDVSRVNSRDLSACICTFISGLGSHLVVLADCSWVVRLWVCWLSRCESSLEELVAMAR